MDGQEIGQEEDVGYSFGRKKKNSFLQLTPFSFFFLSSTPNTLSFPLTLLNSKNTYHVLSLFPIHNHSPFILIPISPFTFLGTQVLLGRPSPLASSIPCCIVYFSPIIHPLLVSELFQKNVDQLFQQTPPLISLLIVLSSHSTF